VDTLKDGVRDDTMCFCFVFVFFFSFSLSFFFQTVIILSNTDKASQSVSLRCFFSFLFLDIYPGLFLVGWLALAFLMT